MYLEHGKTDRVVTLSSDSTVREENLRVVARVATPIVVQRELDKKNPRRWLLRNALQSCFYDKSSEDKNVDFKRCVVERYLIRKRVQSFFVGIS